jgi:hypothetical protein
MVDRFLDVAKKALLFRDTLAHERRALLDTVASEPDSDLSVLELAEQVQPADDRRQSDAVRSGRRLPSVPRTNEPEDAFMALAAYGVIRALEKVTAELRAGNDLGSALIDAEEALVRIPVIQQAQREILNLALGEITVDEFGQRMVSRDYQAPPADPSERLTQQRRAGAKLHGSESPGELGPTSGE